MCSTCRRRRCGVGGRRYGHGDTLAHVFVFEHIGEYCFEQLSDRNEGAAMTILDDRDLVGRSAACPRRVRVGGQDRRPPSSPRVHSRPAGMPLRYRGTGLGVSATAHQARSGRRVSNAVTVALAGLSALITVWLALLSQSGLGGAEAEVRPMGAGEVLAVVHVQDGETLSSLALRVAPDSPVDRVVDRIRDLNKLDSAGIEAGQSLIAPIS